MFPALPHQEDGSKWQRAATWWFFIAPFNAFKLDISTFVALGFDDFVAWVEMARSSG